MRLIEPLNLGLRIRGVLLASFQSLPPAALDSYSVKPLRDFLSIAEKASVKLQHSNRSKMAGVRLKPRDLTPHSIAVER